MRCAFITMVYKDYDHLRKWVQRHSTWTDRSNLYVLSHGGDVAHHRIADGAQVIDIPREDLARFDRKRANLMFRLRREIEADYDIVFQTDVDELLFQDPAIPFQIPGKAAFAIGMNAFRQGLQLSLPYSKAVATWGEGKLIAHGVSLPDWASYQPEIVDGLYLVHTKFLETAALQSSNQTRLEVARSPNAQVGTLWSEAEASSQKIIDKFNTTTLGQWDEEVRWAKTLLRNKPQRKQKVSVTRPPYSVSKFRVDRPVWMDL